ncbi:hypothetical protein GXW83_33510 [Streptacidiphilus sp. PB12-B1b]|uniref:anti-sigma factor family protein n=1 Tax=Streptacidiphilus sp. PB12-B1b TaxID=2705012 RepID=UPI0015FE7C9B|nr:zf-HC2 domain-containing protein [Streptacidiphilus sp. PB12-B1b]QMU79889.1 hypothetical protein GXW83_33510 [Streptacidiphilus sp. PB12-B1b]
MTASASDPALDSSGHPDVDTLADYTEDLLGPEATAELSAHLAACADCRETCDALEEVRTLLGGTDAPPMPDDIARRIDAALAEEAALRTADSAPPELRTPAAASQPPAGPRRPGSAPDRPAAHSGSTGPAGRRPGRGRSRRLRRAALWASSLAVCGLIVTAALNLHPADTGSTSSSKAAAGRSAQISPQSAPGFTSFSDADLPAQIQSLLQAPPSPGAVGAHPQAVNSGERSSSAGIPSCALQAVNRPGEQPLAVGRGSYHGLAVYALVYPDAADPAHWTDAYLVNAGCVIPSGATSSVLVHRTVPRP